MLYAEIHARAVAKQQNSLTWNPLGNSIIMVAKITKKNLRQKPCFAHAASNKHSRAKFYLNLQEKYIF
ncbi:hypothetical protein DCC62_11435 [candidate division KSB1 bacterium]|nr:MAG: hypothetical protein DCC62_11435 [candidate division KSB1 bacterium]